MPAYDESILVEMSDRLYNRAAKILVYLSLVGALGGVVGGAMLTAPTEDGAVMLLGVAVGGFLGAAFGYLFGMERAFLLRLHAQTIMVQVQIERNTRGEVARVRSA